MKELSIEEKAQRYDDLLVKLQEAKVDNDVCDERYCCVIDDIVPELAESEDERIRKALLEMVHDTTGDSLWVDYNVHKEDAIAWLEKQGEHAKFRDSIQVGDKVTRNEDGVLVNLSQLNRVAKKDEKQGDDKVEPKFKVGDIITNGKIIGKIDENENNKYHGWFGYDKNLSVYYADIPDVENWHKWTIANAKDGDVLVTDDWVFIFKKLNTYGKPVCYCHYDDELGFKVDVNSYMSTGSEIHPATKEQRDTLMKAMADAGYTFDFDKKELKKVEQKPVECSEDNLPEFESYLCLMFQKFRTEYSTKGVCTNGEIIDFVEEHAQKLKDTLCHAWSEEDIMRIDNLIAIIENKGYPDYVEYLEKLKDRVQPQPKEEWSEEDEKDFNTAIQHIENYVNNTPSSQRPEIWADITKLKSLKDRVQLQNIAYYNPYKEVVESIAEMCQHYDKMDLCSLQDFYDNVVVKCKDAKEYDSLFPQSSLKPSDEHYELEEFAKIVRCNLTGISKAVRKLFEAKYLQLTGNKMYGGFKD